ncbi:MAG: methylmalonyl-CoA epimerase [Candidatus Aminicenantes bacterium]|nr:methylmalonyl-CoA epimerase [Candidatus Aminicenantes bacterium]
MAIDHIGIAVRNLEESVARWTALFGVKASPVEELPERGVRLVHLCFPGGPVIELVSPLGPESPVARFLEARGEGIHHFTLEVEDIEGMMEHLKKAGVQFTEDKPRAGAGGSRIAFVHPKTLNGVLLELLEKPG